MTINLQELVDKINGLNEQSKSLYQTGKDAIANALAREREAGLLLIEAKQSLPHGQFLPWIKANFKFTPRHAQYLMSVAKNWEQTLVKCETHFAFKDSPLLSLRTALSLVAELNEPKSKPSPAPPPETVTRFRVSSPNHTHHKEVVEVVTNHGGVVRCRDAKGKEFALLENELIDEKEPIKEEIIDAEFTENIVDNSESLRGAIAITIQYLPEPLLKNVLIQALNIGRTYLPEDVKGEAIALVGCGEMGALSAA
jgi:hypothetical protein